MTEQLHFHFSLSCIGERNGGPLQYSCLENPRNGGAWWAVVYGIAQSQTRLKWLSSSSSRNNLTQAAPVAKQPHSFLNDRSPICINFKPYKTWIRSLHLKIRAKNQNIIILFLFSFQQECILLFFFFVFTGSSLLLVGFLQLWYASFSLGRLLLLPSSGSRAQELR